MWSVDIQAATVKGYLLKPQQSKQTIHPTKQSVRCSLMVTGRSSDAWLVETFTVDWLLLLLLKYKTTSLLTPKYALRKRQLELWWSHLWFLQDVSRFRSPVQQLLSQHLTVKKLYLQTHLLLQLLVGALISCLSCSMSYHHCLFLFVFCTLVHPSVPYFLLEAETHLRFLSYSQWGQWDCAPELPNRSSAKFKTLLFFYFKSSSLLLPSHRICKENDFARSPPSLGADWGTIAGTG